MGFSASRCHWWWSRVDETTFLNCCNQGPIVHLPGDILMWTIMVEWYRQRRTPVSSTRVLWQSHQQNHLIATQEELGEENYDFGLRGIIPVHTSKGFFTCRKILRHGASGFTSPKAAVLRIFIPLINLQTRSCFNPGPLSPVASTLNITPQKWPLKGTAPPTNYLFVYIVHLCDYEKWPLYLAE
jgi:hypothetical protein